MKFRHLFVWSNLTKKVKNLGTFCKVWLCNEHTTVHRKHLSEAHKFILGFLTFHAKANIPSNAALWSFYLKAFSVHIYLVTKHVLLLLLILETLWCSLSITCHSSSGNCHAAQRNCLLSVSNQGVEDPVERCDKMQNRKRSKLKF